MDHRSLKSRETYFARIPYYKYLADCPIIKNSSAVKCFPMNWLQSILKTLSTVSFDDNDGYDNREMRIELSASLLPFKKWRFARARRHAGRINSCTSRCNRVTRGNWRFIEAKGYASSGDLKIHAATPTALFCFFSVCVDGHLKQDYRSLISRVCLRPLLISRRT